MGYYTYFKVDMKPEEPKGLREYLYLEEDRYYALIDALEEIEESHKWYDHEDDMIELSRTFPDTLFELHGEVEEPGDLWRKYFKNGKIQRCPAQITYEEYDESKLQEAK
ncbi:hypothetical protein [Aneurinibacillus migulanus]|uniref:hypothetical protein n=1 Tax=Aneurinibacillus migulanus TaxID=47500 RepID=UPI0020A15FA4|nr:hypothetical protein [Aneurinibacillus migulanus]MCP1354624.1 hypothetical protein [Aneurinibacillus migulanus]